MKSYLRNLPCNLIGTNDNVQNYYSLSGRDGERGLHKFVYCESCGGTRYLSENPWATGKLSIKSELPREGHHNDRSEKFFVFVVPSRYSTYVDMSVASSRRAIHLLTRSEMSCVGLLNHVNTCGRAAWWANKTVDSRVVVPLVSPINSGLAIVNFPRGLVSEFAVVVSAAADVGDGLQM
jgi:hypothetical protein